ncbi:N-methyl-L-tryptophan oxidase [Nocardioides cynanchi]|uniref:N-methyl-L-tryptophan oxidase n=1 Tax=Nocardioides cynanchi TaxID=2558918 RepID=UPI00192D487A|nr:N-methyl-L-tryptophan oxidase [Nocardioides cynanchi]
MRYDVVVVGLGAMGSAATYQLAKAGVRVLGLDRHRPPHNLGSTHGDTRITRVAVGEGLAYVPLVRRSHEIWRELEQQTGTQILTRCGGLVLAPAARGFDMHGTSSFLADTVAAAQAYDVEHQALDPAGLAARFPQFALAGEEHGCLEPGAGLVRPELAVELQLRLARDLGATLATGEQVLGFADHGSHVTVRTPTRTVEAAQLIVTAGPWLPEVVPELAPAVTIHRQVLFWFDLRDPASYPLMRNGPVYIWWPGGDPSEMIYGFPMVDGPAGGAKVAREQYDVVTTPDEVDRVVGADEIEEMYERCVRPRLPALSGRCLRTAVCLYTVTEDSRFLIDRLPSAPNVVVASPCSGHGFKHSAAIGESLAQLVTSGASAIDLSAFALPPAG